MKSDRANWTIQASPIGSQVICGSVDTLLTAIADARAKVLADHVRASLRFIHFLRNGMPLGNKIGIITVNSDKFGIYLTY